MKYGRKSVISIIVLLLVMFTQVNAEEVATESFEMYVKEIDLGDYVSEMKVGDKQLLNVTLIPEVDTNSNVIYSSSNDKVATINGIGRITAIAVGTTKIRVTVDDVVESFELNVIEKENDTIPVTDIDISEHESVVEVGKTIEILGSVIPANATDTTVTYASTNPDIATVTSSGKVKGLQKGNVKIILSAGNISKEVPIIVKQATSKLVLNKEYLVLKKNEDYQLSVSVIPEGANQSITYTSGDKSVATVSSTGRIKAVGTGSTVIIVSNEDLSVAVSVIVNETVIYGNIEEVNAQDDTVNMEYNTYLLASENPTIDSELLRYLYESKTELTIEGDGYLIHIDGSDIVNYNNEFWTDIYLKEENDRQIFILNNGEELCGEITLQLENPMGKYLYLYNKAKNKYERLNISDVKNIKLTTSGKYQLSQTELKDDKRVLIYGAIGGSAVLIVCFIMYVLIKKRYWFW